MMLRLWRRLKNLFAVRFASEVFRRYGRDNGSLLAAGLAFFVVIAFIPLLLVGLWLVGHVYADKPDRAVAVIQKLLTTEIIPGAAGVEVEHLMQRAGIADNQGHAGAALLHIIYKRGIAGAIGLVALLWAAMQVFINGSVAMNAAWEVKERRGWIKLRLLALGLLGIAGALLAVSLLLTAFATRTFGGPWGRLFPGEGWVRSVLFEAVAFLVATLMYTTVYQFLPAAKVPWRAAAAGGVLSAVAWEIAKKALAVYLLHPNRSLYGDLANLIILFLWILYSMMILLLGAEASAVYADMVLKE
jgi:membrane protein